MSEPDAAWSEAAVDYLIVGAGGAGCVLASRLSERPQARVLLLEAGPDLPPGQEPPDVRSVFPRSAFNPQYMWPDTRVHWRCAEDSPNMSLPQGKILGGSSTVHGMWALRGRPDDYDEWERLGAEGWGWNGVAPFFARLETDEDFDGSLHGREGPVPIRREPRTAWSSLALAVSTATLGIGMPHIEDANADFRDGHCTLPNSRFERSRASSSSCYLDAKVRSRSNLEIRCERTVQRVIFSGRRAVGAVIRRSDGSEEQIRAREIILTAGALRTPVLLMRSGIGPAQALKSAGIPVLHDHPGVGGNLQNHPVLYVVVLLRKRARDRDCLEKPAASTYLRWSSREEGCPKGDVGLYVRSYLTPHPLGRRFGSLAPVLLKPVSRGSIRLDRRDPAGAPVIEFRFLEDPRDLKRLMLGVYFAADVFNSKPLQSVCHAAFVLRDLGALTRFNARSLTNRLHLGFAALGLDVAPAYGASALAAREELRPLTEVTASAEALAALISEGISGTGHVCGTCRMGRGDDRFAVVDRTARVWGLEALRVADASVMPTIPCGNTYLSTVMLAEKIAASIIEHE